MSVEPNNEVAPHPPARGIVEELRSFGETIPHKALFAVLLVAWAALFHFLGNGTFGYAKTPSIFGWLREVYHYSPDDESLGLMIPPLILGLLWWKRAELAPVGKSVWWPGLISFGGAVVLHVLGYVVQQPRVSLVALLFGVYALTGLLWGWHWLKATFFPLFLLAFLIPLPMDLEGMTLPLRLVSTKTAVAIGHILGISDVAQGGTTIVFPDRHLRYEVEAACSGLRSLTVMTLISSIFAFMYFRSKWRRALIILSAVPLAIVSNSLRLLSIIVGGDWKYSQLKNAGLPIEEVHQGAQSFGLLVHDHTVLKLVPYVLGFSCLMLLAKWLRDDAPAAEKKGVS